MNSFDREVRAILIERTRITNALYSYRTLAMKPFYDEVRRLRQSSYVYLR